MIIPSNACRLKGAKGYTLVEVSIACFVLAIGLTSILSIMPPAISWGSAAIDSSTGACAARSCLDHFCGVASYSTLPTTSKNYYTVGQYYCSFGPFDTAINAYPIEVRRANNDLVYACTAYIYDRP